MLLNNSLILIELSMRFNVALTSLNITVEDIITLSFRNSQWQRALNHNICTQQFWFSLNVSLTVSLNSAVTLRCNFVSKIRLE